MRKREDFQRAFGQADAGFEQNIHNTLDALMAREEEKYLKRKLKLTTVVALAAMLVLGSVAFAATNVGGILDLLRGQYENHPEVLPKATSEVASNIEQKGGNTGEAQFTVREAIYDGTHFYITVEARPLTEKTLLLGVDSDPEMPVSDFQADWLESDAPNIAAWAEEQGYEKVLYTNVHTDGVESLDYHLQPDGSMLYLVKGTVEGAPEGPETLDIALRCQTAQYEKVSEAYTLDEKALNTAELDFALASSGHFAGKEAENLGLAIPEAGISIESVRLYASYLTVYTEVVYEVTDVEKYLDDEGYSSLDIRFVDDQDKELPDGVFGSGSFEPLDEAAFKANDYTPRNGDRFVLKWDLQASETLPDSIRLQVFNYETGETFDTVEIEFE